MLINIIVQARSSSKRYKNKVLQTLFRESVILHLVKKLQYIKYVNKVIVATSNENSDNELCSLLKKNKIIVFRGPLQNVYSRFRLCSIMNTSDYFVRISADSPFLNSNFLQLLINIIKKNPQVDILSNIVDRMYPKGQSIEICKTKRFISLKSKIKKNSEIEHVTQFFYNNNKKFNFLSIKPKKPMNIGVLNSCVDYPNDIFTKKKFLNDFKIKNLYKNFLISKV
tara:strand:+ start:1421 stop:2095 length:675 start_codon:yes stop_codon:yes gene_type:complete